MNDAAVIISWSLVRIGKRKEKIKRFVDVFKKINVVLSDFPLNFFLCCNVPASVSHVLKAIESRF